MTDTNLPNLSVEELWTLTQARLQGLVRIQETLDNAILEADTIRAAVWGLATEYQRRLALVAIAAYATPPTGTGLCAGCGNEEGIITRDGVEVIDAHAVTTPHGVVICAGSWTPADTILVRPATGSVGDPLDLDAVPPAARRRRKK